MNIDWISIIIFISMNFRSLFYFVVFIVFWNLVFCNPLYSQFQEFGYGHTKEKIKDNHVRSLSIYNFINDKDSFLMAESYFNSSGDLYLHKEISEDGTLIFSDTLIYENGKLISKTQTGKSGNSAMKYSYDANSELLANHYSSDSLNETVTSKKYKLRNGNRIVNYHSSTRDSTVFENTYNKKGNLKRSLVTGSNKHITDVKMVYDWMGRLVERTSSSPANTVKTIYKYDKKGNVIRLEIISGFKKNQNQITIVLYSYYPNDLGYEEYRYFNRRLPSKKRIYYNYY